MTNLTKQLFSVITAGALVVNTAGTAFAGTTIQISGNGAGSDNFTTVNQSSTTTVTQSNTANVTNNVDSDANTGGNDASFNTGGNTTVTTGPATSNTTVTNTLNTNSAQVGCNNCANGGTDVLVQGNGGLSNNTVAVGSSNATTLNQTNVANVSNTVDSDANSGRNNARLNTGGDVTIQTGGAYASTNVKTTANANVASVGNGLPAGATVTPAASFRILGNGAGSDNFINATLVRGTTLNQINNAGVNNNVDADANTGNNDAGFNTGGDVTIQTLGGAVAKVGVDNMVNFNAANLDCGCELGVLAKIDGNGAELPFPFLSANDNVINLGLYNANAVTSVNGAGLNNQVDDVHANAGYNNANSNTAGVVGLNDPSIQTGGASTTTNVTNSGNSNVVGSVTLPWSNSNMNFMFNMQALMAFFGMSL